MRLLGSIYLAISCWCCVHMMWNGFPSHDICVAISSLHQNDLHLFGKRRLPDELKHECHFIGPDGCPHAATTFSSSEARWAWDDGRIRAHATAERALCRRSGRSWALRRVTGIRGENMSRCSLTLQTRDWKLVESESTPPQIVDSVFVKLVLGCNKQEKKKKWWWHFHVCELRSNCGVVGREIPPPTALE